MFLIVIYLVLSTVAVLYYWQEFNKINSKIRSIVILSGNFDWDTISRAKKGIDLKRNFKNAKFAVCGKYRGFLAEKIIQSHRYKSIILQDKSTNTYEDAFFLKKVSNDKDLFPMAVVPSQPHLRRALHTFAKVFPNRIIYGFATNDFLNIYSPFLPSGWLAIAINVIKDWK